MSWNILYLPAEDPETGVALWPEYFPSAKLKAIRQQMGSPLFSCMYMGNPAGLSGEIFSANWFKLAQTKIAPRPLLVPEQLTQWLQVDGEEPIDFDELLFYQFWDLAISEKETADYTVGLTLALHPPTMHETVMEVRRGHWSFEQTQRQIALAADQWKPHAIGIESTAYQAAAVQEARKHLNFAVQEVRVDRDKVTRARLPAALAESGKMSVVRGVWADDFFDEVMQFPNGRHDDIVDALSGAATLAQAYVPSGFLLFK